MVNRGSKIIFIGRSTQRQASSLMTPNLLRLKIYLPLTSLGTSPIPLQVNYLHQFLSKNLGEKTATLLELLGETRVGAGKHLIKKAFDLLKLDISQPPLLNFFDPAKPLRCQWKLQRMVFGVTCLQDGYPVTYARRALTATSFPEFSTERERERERPWKTLVTWLQNKIISEGGVLCLTFFYLVYWRRLRSDRNSKIDLLTLLQL